MSGAQDRTGARIPDNAEGGGSGGVGARGKGAAGGGGGAGGGGDVGGRGGSTGGATVGGASAGGNGQGWSGSCGEGADAGSGEDPGEAMKEAYWDALAIIELVALDKEELEMSFVQQYPPPRLPFTSPLRLRRLCSVRSSRTQAPPTKFFLMSSPGDRAPSGEAARSRPRGTACHGGRSGRASTGSRSSCGRSLC